MRRYTCAMYFAAYIIPYLLLWLLAWAFLPSGISFFVWSVIGACLLPALCWFIMRTYKRDVHPSRTLEKYFVRGMAVCCLLSLLTTGSIFFSLLFEGVKFFAKISPWSFFTGAQWAPPIFTPVSPEEEAHLYGALPLFLGTFVISIIAVICATFMGLLCAIAIREYKLFPRMGRPILENLAAIPTVVYGVFAIIVVSPYVHELGVFLGLNVSAESALAAGLVMGIMLIPFISSLFDDALVAVPKTLRDAARALGATEREVLLNVVLPAAFPGLVASLLLAFSRAIGETMIVVMAAGLAANLSLNPFAALTTVTVQIANLFVGDQEFGSTSTQSAFALGLSLFLVTFIINALSIRILQKIQKRR